MAGWVSEEDNARVQCSLQLLGQETCLGLRDMNIQTQCDIPSSMLLLHSIILLSDKCTKSSGLYTYLLLHVTG
jgi:hypothetical protein